MAIAELKKAIDKHNLLMPTRRNIKLELYHGVPEVLIWNYEYGALSIIADVYLDYHLKREVEGFYGFSSITLNSDFKLLLQQVEIDTHTQLSLLLSSTEVLDKVVYMHETLLQYNITLQVIPYMLEPYEIVEENEHSIIASIHKDITILQLDELLEEVSELVTIS